MRETSAKRRVLPARVGAVEEAIGQFWFGDSCVYDGQFEYDDGVYLGLIDEYSGCGPEGSTFYQVIAKPPDESFIVSVQIVAVTEADLLAAEEVFATFFVSDLGG